MNEDGGFDMTVTSPLGSDVLAIPESALEGHSHLTDTSACYVSFSPWATQSTMSVEITAIHTEEEPEPDLPDGPDGPTEPEGPTDSDDVDSTEKLGFFEAIIEFFRSIFKGIEEFFTELFKP